MLAIICSIMDMDSATLILSFLALIESTAAGPWTVMKSTVMAKGWVLDVFLLEKLPNPPYMATSVLLWCMSWPWHVPSTFLYKSILWTTPWIVHSIYVVRAVKLRSPQYHTQMTATTSLFIFITKNLGVSHAYFSVGQQVLFL